MAASGAPTQASVAFQAWTIHLFTAFSSADDDDCFIITREEIIK
jgi:hypothetical protein